MEDFKEYVINIKKFKINIWCFGVRYLIKWIVSERSGDGGWNVGGDCFISFIRKFIWFLYKFVDLYL